MRIPRPLHRWNVTPARAIEIQRRLARRVRIEPLAGPVRFVAGADVTFTPDEAYCIAGIVVWDLLRREIAESAVARRAARFPYVPGLLSFREAPAVLAAVRKLRIMPDAFMFDGQGLAHPRRFGLACHVGLCLDRPSLGCAKSRLCGEYEEPAQSRGASSPLRLGDETVGAVLRTRDGVKPVYVSVGHRVTLRDAVRLVLDCDQGVRLPEPTRRAHHLVTVERYRAT